jgi:uncharacterized protein Yka (UPF0111/DUF47 family)
MSRRTRQNASQRPASRWRRIVLALAPDVVGLLATQGEVSLEALTAFQRWSADARPEDAQLVHDLEHKADEARVAVVTALRVALATPIDQEDLYVLAERCDHVVNAVKNIVSEAEALAWTPDIHAAEMAAALHDGMVELLEGFRDLARQPEQVGATADRVVRHARRVEHEYRTSMAELTTTVDLRGMFTCREFYRSYARAAETLVGVADRLWYAVLSGA